MTGRWVAVLSALALLAGWSGLAEEASLPLTYRLDRKLLDASLAAGRSYLLLNQAQEGDFVYGYNIETGEFDKDDNQVRQAGALWGVALYHRDQPTLLTQKALTAGLAYFALNSKHVAEVGRYPVYGTDRYGIAGTAALVTLTHVEMLASTAPLKEQEALVFNAFLDQYLAFLNHLRRPDGRYASFYFYTAGKPFGDPSPYYDGEALLTLARAADLRRDDVLASQAIASAEAMFQAYAAKPIAERLEDQDAKSFFQWGCLALRDLYLSGRPGTEGFARRTIDYANWMIDVHRVLERTGNTGYAFEGIVCAYDLARRIEDHETADRLAGIIDRGLYNLTTWQVGGPLENEYLAKLKVRDPIAVGGVLGGANDPWLRIDTAQHQMHALLLARRYVYSP